MVVQTPWYSEGDSTPPTPWVTILIILMCIVIFVVQVFAKTRLNLLLDERYGFVPAVILGRSPPPVGSTYLHALLNLIVSAFLHGGVAHLLGNMYFFWIFGRQVEESMGRATYAVFIAVMILAASLAYAFSNPSSTDPCIGASGFISGIMGAYLLLFPTTHMTYVSYGRTVPVPVWVFLGLWIAKQLYCAYHPGQFGNEHIAFWAHIGGFASGILLSWVLWKMGFAIVDEDALERASR